MKTRKNIAVLLLFMLLTGVLPPITAVHSANVITVWDEQFMTPYPYTMGQVVEVGYNANQDATMMGQWYRPGSTCTIRYTALETGAAGVPAFPANGYTPSGHGNVQKFEFLAQDQASSSTPSNGIAYRIPTINSGKKVTAEVGFYISTITNYGSDWAKWFRIALGGAELKLYNSGSGNASSGSILYQDVSNATSGNGLGINSGSNWSSGWHKVKFELWKNSPEDSGYNRVNYYYDNMTTPLNSAPLIISDSNELSHINFYMGARGTDPSPPPLYYDYITVTVDDSDYTEALSAPTKPIWSNNVITWEGSQSNIAAYEVALYKNSQKFKTYAVESDVKKYNFTAELSTDLSAQWTVSVKAMGIKNNSMLIGDSPESAMSDVCSPIEILPLPTPAAPVWDTSLSGSVLAIWNNVAGNNGYSIKLYKDGILVGTYSAATNITSMDLNGHMEVNGSGAYTVRVTALGDNGETCMDSVESPLSANHNYTVPTIDFKRVLIDQGFNAPPHNVTSIGTPEWNVNAVVDNSGERGIMLRNGTLVVAHGQGTPFSNTVRSIVLDGNFEKTTARYVEYEGKITGISPGSQFYMILIGETAEGTYAEAGGMAMIGSELRPATGLYGAALPFNPAVPVTAGTAYDIRFRASKPAGCSENDSYTSMKWWINGTERTASVALPKNVVRITGVRFGSTTSVGSSWAIHPFTLKDNLEKLDSIEAPTWGNGAKARTLYWNPVTNNRGYVITLYKEGVSSPLGQYTAPQDSTSFDMEQAFLGAGLGNVYVTIRARGDGVYMISGPISPRSANFQIKPTDMEAGPNATNVRVSAGLDGKSLVGSYIYRNSDTTVTEGNTTFRWLISDTEQGAYDPIPNATDKVYNLSQSDLTKYIRFEVTPRDSAGNTGDYVRSSAARPTVMPVAIDVAFTRNNDTLTGEYTYFHFAGTLEGKTQFKWLMADFENGDYRAIPGENEATLKLKDNQKLKYIKFEVTPGDSNGRQGYSYQSDGMIDANPNTFAIIAASKLEPSALTVEQPSRITKNLNLPDFGLYDSTIKWSSDKPSIISDNGMVTRPKHGASEVVTLTAEVTVGGKTQTRTYKFIVLSLDVLGDGRIKDPIILRDFLLNEKDKDIFGIFSDVDNDHWAKPYILFLYERGILNGTGEGLFEPERPISREEFCKILVGAFDMLNRSAPVQFEDVPEWEWYYTSVASALENKIIFGKSSELFGTGEALLRQDMAVMLGRTAFSSGIYLPQETKVFELVDFEMIDEYARESTGLLLGAGIIGGDQNGYFNPKKTTTRAEVAKAICMLYLLK